MNCDVVSVTNARSLGRHKIGLEGLEGAPRIDPLKILYFSKRWETETEFHQVGTERGAQQIFKDHKWNDITKYNAFRLRSKLFKLNYPKMPVTRIYFSLQALPRSYNLHVNYTHHTAASLGGVYERHDAELSSQLSCSCRHLTSANQLLLSEPQIRQRDNGWPPRAVRPIKIIIVIARETALTYAAKRRDPLYK